MSHFGQIVSRLPYPMRRVVEELRHTAIVLASLRGVHPRTCTICGYHGKFRASGLPPRFDVRCAKCDSLPRHRLFHLLDERHGLLNNVKSLIHFAPEHIFERMFAQRFAEYKTADLFRHDVDYKTNIEETGLPSNSFDAAFVSHVLEHVNDREAIKELNRILKPGGVLIAMVPIVDGWPTTYENPSVVSERDRDLHFGQKDHVRFYGQDFVDRLEKAFSVTSFMGSPEECAKYGLFRGERVFVARKADLPQGQVAAE